MKNERKETTLGDIVTLHYGKALQSARRTGGDIPVYSSAGVTSYHNESLVKTEGIVIGRKGSIGTIYYSKTPFFCIDTAYYVLLDKRYDLLYLFYLLQSLELDSFNEDSAVPGLNRNTAYSQRFLLPPLPVQRAIAEVLSSLDDKIDLFTRQNATLEALAQTYFRQWFIEDNGNEPLAVSDIATLENDSINPARQPLVSFCHYSIPAFDNAQTPVIELGRTILSNKFIVLLNTILVSKLNPITPRIWRIDEYAKPNSICSTEFQVLKPKNKQHYFFLYCLMKSNDVTASFTMSTTRTSGSHQRIRPEYVLEVETPTPDDHKLDLFNEICTLVMERMKKN